jgi:hypothetical protein
MMGMIVESVTTAMKVDLEEMLITVSIPRRFKRYVKISSTCCGILKTGPCYPAAADQYIVAFNRSGAALS